MVALMLSGSAELIIWDCYPRRHLTAARPPRRAPAAWVEDPPAAPVGLWWR